MNNYLLFLRAKVHKIVSDSKFHSDVETTGLDFYFKRLEKSKFSCIFAVRKWGYILNGLISLIFCCLSYKIY